MRDVRAMMDYINSASVAMTEKEPEIVGGFFNFLAANEAEGDLSPKVKELISVAVAIHSRCEYCIVCHVYNAFKHGATKGEIREAALTAVTFGGGPSLSYVSTLLEDCIAEFEKDFQ